MNELFLDAPLIIWLFLPSLFCELPQVVFLWRYEASARLPILVLRQ
jgi:hypothetical protein